MTDDRGSSAAKAATINVTPLVDILLVLLIIFMVITPLLQTGFQTHLPTGGPGARSTSIVLQIFRDGRLSMNRQTLSEKELPGQLSAIYGTRGDKTLFIDAEDGVPYETVVRVLAGC